MLLKIVHSRRGDTFNVYRFISYNADYLGPFAQKKFSFKNYSK